MKIFHLQISVKHFSMELNFVGFVEMKIVQVWNAYQIFCFNFYLARSAQG